MRTIHAMTVSKVKVLQFHYHTAAVERLCYFVLLLLLLLSVSKASVPTLQDFEDNSRCMYVKNTTALEWISLKDSFSQAVASSLNSHCSFDHSKCGVAAGAIIVVFSIFDIQILSAVELVGLVKVTFAVGLPINLSPINSPSVVPRATLADITDSLVVNILGTTQKTADICNVTLAAISSTVTMNEVSSTGAPLNIISSTVTMNEISSSTLTLNEISSSTLTMNEISSSTLTMNEISSSTLTMNEISSSTLTMNEISSSTFFDIDITSSTVTDDIFSTMLVDITSDIFDDIMSITTNTVYDMSDLMDIDTSTVDIGTVTTVDIDIGTMNITTDIMDASSLITITSMLISSTDTISTITEPFDGSSITLIDSITDDIKTTPSDTFVVISTSSKLKTDSIITTPTNTEIATPTYSMITSPTSIDSISTTPTDSISTTPTDSISTTPTDSISTTPTDYTSTTPTDSISTTPTHSISTTPTHSISTTPTHSILTTPINSTHSINATLNNSMIATPIDSVVNTNVLVTMATSSPFINTTTNAGIISSSASTSSANSSSRSNIYQSSLYSVLVPTVISPSRLPPSTIPIDERSEKKNSVIITIGLTSLEQWNSDLNLQLTFALAIISEATSYCAEYLQKCGLLSSVAFSTYNIIVQDGYPVAFVTGSSIRLSIALAIPNGARLLSPGMVPLISGETLLEIILRAATPIYLQTGRPILEVQNYREPQRTQNTGIVVGTIVPLAIVLVICIGILILFAIIYRQIRKHRSIRQNQLPGEEDEHVNLMHYRKLTTD